MTKPPLDLPGQLKLLKERGFAVGDEQRLARFLYDNSYYRLSGYWRYLQLAPHMGDDSFQAGTTQESVKEIYQFDAILRNVLMEGLAELEVTMRARIAYAMAMKPSGDINYLDRDTYIEDFDVDGTEHRDKLIAAISLELLRSKERFVRRYRDRAEQIPVWVAAETMTLGTLSKIYRLLNDEPARETIAKRFDMGDSAKLETTLRSMTVLRNIVAHHGRIWNRVLTVPPVVMNRLKVGDKGVYVNTPWSWLVVLADLVRTVRDDDSYSTTLFNFVGECPEMLDGLQRPHNR